MAGVDADRTAAQPRGGPQTAQKVLCVLLRRKLQGGDWNKLGRGRRIISGARWKYHVRTVRWWHTGMLASRRPGCGTIADRLPGGDKCRPVCRATNSAIVADQTHKRPPGARAFCRYHCRATYLEARRDGYTRRAVCTSPTTKNPSRRNRREGAPDPASRPDPRRAVSARAVRRFALEGRSVPLPSPRVLWRVEQPNA